MSTYSANDPKLTEYMISLLKTIAPKIERIKNFNYIESVVKVKSEKELVSLVTLLEKYYLTTKSISVLAAFLPSGMVTSFHVGSELAGSYDQVGIALKIHEKYANLVLEKGKPLSSGAAKKLFFASAREFVLAHPEEIGPEK